MENGVLFSSYEFTSLVRADLIVRAIFAGIFALQCIPIASSHSQIRKRKARSPFSGSIASIVSIVFGNGMVIIYDAVYGFSNAANSSDPPPKETRVILFILSTIALRVGFAALYLAMYQLVEDRHESIMVEIVENPQEMSQLNQQDNLVQEQTQPPEAVIRREKIVFAGQGLVKLFGSVFMAALIILAAISAGTLTSLYSSMLNRQTDRTFEPIVTASMNGHISRSSKLTIAFYSIWAAAAVHIVVYASLLKKVPYKQTFKIIIANGAVPLYFLLSLTSIIIFAILTPNGLPGGVDRIITSVFTYQRTQAALAGVVITGFFTALLINIVIGILPGRSTTSRFEKWRMRWAAKYARGGDEERKPAHDTLIYNA